MTLAPSACQERAAPRAYRGRERDEEYSSGRELIPRLKSGALEIDHQQLDDSG